MRSGVEMAGCDLCSDSSAVLYTVEGSEGNEYHLCEDCLKVVHEAYVEIR